MAYVLVTFCVAHSCVSEKSVGERRMVCRSELRNVWDAAVSYRRSTIPVARCGERFLT